MDGKKKEYVFTMPESRIIGITEAILSISTCTTHEERHDLLMAIHRTIQDTLDSQREEFVKDLEEAYNCGALIDGDIYGWEKADKAKARFNKLKSKWENDGREG